MTTAYNPARCAELVREIREDDARMTPAPWALDEDIACIYSGELEVVVLGEEANNYDGDGPGIERTRNRLRETADQIEAAMRRIAELEAERLRLGDDEIETLRAAAESLAFACALPKTHEAIVKVHEAIVNAHNKNEVDRG